MSLAKLNLGDVNDDEERDVGLGMVKIGDADRWSWLFSSISIVRAMSFFWGLVPYALPLIGERSPHRE